jgi:putative salt-induced outer membrane protein
MQNKYDMVPFKTNSYRQGDSMLRKFCLTALALFLTAGTAFSAEKLFGGEGEIGMMITSGNSDTESVNGRIGLAYETDRLISTADFQGLYKSEKTEDQDGVRRDQASAQKHRASAKIGYKFTDNDYAFIRGAYINDRFSGYHYQNTVSAGYGRRLLTGDRANLSIELGPGYRYEKIRTGGSEENAIFRASGLFTLMLTEGTAFEQNLSVETGDDKTITRSVSAIRARIIGALSMKLSYTIDRQSEVPADTEKTNTESALTLVYGF